MYSRKLTKNEDGFTLIEMLVSVALFAIVLTATMGTIITIVDANKKARSLMSVMTNLNFAIDSVTRSIKAGSMVDNSGNSIGDLVSVNKKCVRTNQIRYNTEGEGDFLRELVEFCHVVDTQGNGKITKRINNGTALDLTSPDVNIKNLNFYQPGGKQPRVVMTVQGEVKISERVTSEFSIQTTVSQRQLNLASLSQ